MPSILRFCYIRHSLWVQLAFPLFPVPLRDHSRVADSFFRHQNRKNHAFSHRLKTFCGEDKEVKENIEEKIPMFIPLAPGCLLPASAWLYRPFFRVHYRVRHRAYSMQRRPAFALTIKFQRFFKATGFTAG